MNIHCKFRLNLIPSGEKFLFNYSHEQCQFATNDYLTYTQSYDGTNH